MQAEKVICWKHFSDSSKLSKHELKKRLCGFSDIKYNHENFEDFLVLHLSDSLINQWHKICGEKNHFNIPMVGKEVAKAIHQIFPDYIKGCLPEAIQINDESLGRLYKNHEDQQLYFESDFVDVIQNITNPKK